MKLSLRFWGLVVTAAHAAAQCSGQISISSQSDADALADCDTIDGDVSISSDASGTISLPDIEEIRGTFTIEGASNLNGLRANDLESITGPVTIKDNANLNQVSMSGLSDIGGDLNVEGNDNLNDFALNDLETLRGGMNLDGAFNQLSFSNLARINGQTNIRSTGSFSCGSLQSSSGGDDDEGGNGSVFSGSSFTCRTGADATSTTSSTTSTATSTSSSSTSTGTTTSTSSSTSSPTATTTDTPSASAPLSGGAIAGVVVAAVVVVLLIILFLWWFLRRRRKNAAPPPPPLVDEKPKSMPPSTGDGPNGGPPGAAPGGSNIDTTKNVARKPLVASQAMMDRFSTGSTGMPAALVAGDRSSLQQSTTTGDDGSLFLHAIPRQRPSEADVPMLDSGHVHEVSAEPDRAIYEMDAGPVSTHQQPINQ